MDPLDRLDRQLHHLPGVLPRVLRALRYRPHWPMPWQARVALAVRRLRRDLSWEPTDHSPGGQLGLGGATARKRRPDVQERWHQLIHAFHSFRASAILGATVLVVLVFTCAIFGWGVPGQAEFSPGILGAIAAVLGTVAGLLLAVAVFALQFHGQRLGRASFLIQYLARREGLVPIAALLFAVIGANAIAALVAHLWLPTAAAAMAFMDLFLVPMTLGITLRLFYRLVTSVSGDFVGECVIPGLRWEYEHALQEELLEVRAEEEKRSGAPTPRGARKAGKVLREVRKSLRWALGIGPPQSHQVRDVLSRFGGVIVEQAKHAPPDDFQRSLDVVESLVEPWITRADPDRQNTPFNPLLLSEDVWDARLWLQDVSEGAISSRSRDKVTALLRFAYAAFSAGIELRSPRTFADARLITSHLYRIAVGGEDRELADFLGRDLDNWILFGTLGQFGSRHPDRFDPARDLDEIPILIEALGWVLRLLNFAIQANREEDARNFLDRLFPFDWNDYERYAGLSPRGTFPSEMRGIYELHVYAQVVIAGWGLYLAKERGWRKQVAATVVNHARCRLGTRRDILRAWEAVRNQYPYIDDQLGVANWSMEIESPRTGQVVSQWSPERWIFEGAVALLLARPSRGERAALDDLAQPPAQRYDLNEIERIARGWLDNDYVCKTLLDIAADQREPAFEAMKELFGSRQRAYERKRLEEVITGRVPDERCEALLRQIFHGLSEHRKLVAALGLLRESAESGGQNETTSVLTGCHLPKECLLPGGADISGLGKRIAYELARLEALEIAKATCSIAPVFEQFPASATLQDAVLRAMGTLAGGRYQPSLIFLPRREDFAVALFGAPAENAPEHGALGPDHLGRWKGCQVLRWPDGIDAACVVVMDAAAFFQRCAPADETPLTLDVQEPNADVHRQWLAEAEAGREHVHTADEVTVIVVARLLLGVAVRDPNAALRIDLAPSR